MLNHMILHRTINAKKHRDDLHVSSNIRDGQVRDPVKLPETKQSDRKSTWQDRENSPSDKQLSQTQARLLVILTKAFLQIRPSH